MRNLIHMVLTGRHAGQVNYVNKIHFCATKLNSVSQNSILCHKIQFCVTKFNFVPQNSILCHKIQFCVTKFNFVRQNWVLWTKFSFVGQNSVLSTKVSFVCKLVCVTDSLCHLYVDWLRSVLVHFTRWWSTLAGLNISMRKYNPIYQYYTTLWTVILVILWLQNIYL